MYHLKVGLEQRFIKLYLRKKFEELYITLLHFQITDETY